MDRGFGAWRKIERAKQHIADIESRVAALPDGYTASIQIDPQRGKQFVKYDSTDTSAPIDLALMIGDCVHNLKCALDYAWIGTLTRFGLASRYTKFPVYESRDRVEAALRNAKVDRIPGLFELVVSGIGPHQGRNYYIWSIHEMDNMDKHRLLIPLLRSTTVNGFELENERGESTQGDSWPVTFGPPLYIDVPPGWQLKNQGKVSVEVIFNQGTPIDGLEVTDTLPRFVRVAGQAVEFLQDFTP